MVGFLLYSMVVLRTYPNILEKSQNAAPHDRTTIKNAAPEFLDRFWIQNEWIGPGEREPDHEKPVINAACEIQLERKGP